MMRAEGHPPHRRSILHRHVFPSFSLRTVHPAPPPISPPSLPWDEGWGGRGNDGVGAALQGTKVRPRTPRASRRRTRASPGRKRRPSHHLVACNPWAFDADDRRPRASWWRWSRCGVRAAEDHARRTSPSSTATPSYRFGAFFSRVRPDVFGESFESSPSEEEDESSPSSLSSSSEVSTSSYRERFSAGFDALAVDAVVQALGAPAGIRVRRVLRRASGDGRLLAHFSQIHRSRSERNAPRHPPRVRRTCLRCVRRRPPRRLSADQRAQRTTTCA